jgi:hypothetical protein
MKNTSLFALASIGLCLFCLQVVAQNNASSPQKYQLHDYSIGRMLVGVRIPNNWDAGPVIIGKISESGELFFEWPSTVPEALKNAADPLHYVLRTGNCDAGEDGKLESDIANYVLFDRIWLIHPETKDVQGQLMAASNDTLRKWMHRPDDEKTTKGTYAYLLYAFQDNTLRSTCQFESWITPEGQSEITLEHKFENDLKVTKGFQFVVYDNKEVHPYEGMQPKWQQVSAAISLPETINWKVKE